MTQRIIYHDFRKETAPKTVTLTAPMLRKGRRMIRTFAHINTTLNIGCIFLCGACSAVSVLVLLLLARA
jgi:hypothetical protein